MIDRQFKLNNSFIGRFKEITLELFAIQLNKAIIFLTFLTEIYKPSIRSQAEVDSIVFVNLLDCIGYTFEVKRDLKNSLY